MALPAAIAALIETFAANEADYTATEFKEAQVRQQFIDPFFAALGWDVANTQGYAEAYKEVIHEDAIKIGGETKAPDYSFRIGGNRKFFVEAKKPSVSLKDNPEPAFQLRRYTWTVKLPLGILTDFQEFAIYDGRFQPFASDKASVARLFYCRFDELEKHWDFIAGIFSKEAVLKGNFDKYAAATKGKRGTITVDEAFLKEIENWRDLLARNLALRNPDLDTRGLNFAVQRTIDRIVFLRIAEDRGNEPFGQLQALLGAVTSGGGAVEEEPPGYGGGRPRRAPTIYPRLVEIFEKADYRYNSGLFHFAKDADCAETPDTLTPGLHIDDAVLKEILGSLYYPNSSYAFGYLPAYILGHVYEQFLGKVIRLTDGHQAKVEEKPEVRKAGGVYYTPQYIVDYIVQKTVGPLVDGKTPKQLETLAVLDPACGSGTFLLGAYDSLLKWYLDFYSANTPEKWAKQSRIYETAPNAAWHGRLAHDPKSGTGVPPVIPRPARSWSLTTAERKRILLAHIHGVDIDSQAVEVTKLSLLLKVLEGEHREFHGRTREMAAVLPDLSKNIQCGNSLIGHDFYQQPDLPSLDAEAKYKLNTFEWKDGFPEVMKRGGFDAVIGNPPYGATFTTEEGAYLNTEYKFQSYQLDSYLLFMEKSFSLCNAKGKTGIIIPNTWLLNLTNGPLRKAIFAQHEISEIVHYLERVFPKVTVDVQVCIFAKSKPTKDHAVQISLVHAKDSISGYKIPQNQWIDLDGRPVNILQRPEALLLANRIGDLPKLGKIFQITQGTKPFQVGKGTPKQTQKIVDEKLFVSDSKKDKTFRPLLRGSLIHKYQIKWNNDYWISFGDWLAEPRYSAGYDAPAKIVIRQTGDSLIATLDKQQFIARDNLYTIIAKNTSLEIEFLLGLLNSRFLTWYYQNIINPEKGEALAQVKRGHIAELPIPFAGKNKSNKVVHDKIVKLVNEMLDLHRAQAAAQTPHEKDALAKQITATDRQIDALVYQLYALTPEEIALVEGTS